MEKPSLLNLTKHAFGTSKKIIGLNVANFSIIVTLFGVCILIVGLLNRTTEFMFLYETSEKTFQHLTFMILLIQISVVALGFFVFAGLKIGFYHCVSYEQGTKRYNAMFAPFKNPIFLACLTIIAMIIFSIPMIIDRFYPAFGAFVHSHTPALWAVSAYHLAVVIWWSITLIILSDNYFNSQKSAKYLCCAMLRSVLCICKGFFGLLYIYILCYYLENKI